MKRPSSIVLALLLLVFACAPPAVMQSSEEALAPRETTPASEPPAFTPAHATGDPLVVKTEAGALQGRMVGEVRAFLGIPFAEPPVGALRFRSPVPKIAWTGMRDATHYGSACAQTQPNGQPQGSEDCLYLNVWAPTNLKPNERRPVMFFIHGGALVLGASNQTAFLHTSGNLYDGRALAESQGVIVISTNYRLAQLGFLAHPALAKEDAHGSSGNYGTLDQIEALTWTQHNIAAFGGDPNRVMLYGESAGGLSTCLLVSSPLARGLFSRALIESGGCTVQARNVRERQGIALATGLGCGANTDVATCLRRKPLALLRSRPVLDMSIFGVSTDLERAWTMPFGPTIDGYVFEERPLQAIRKHATVPLVVGTNANEFELFTPPLINTCLDYRAAVAGIFVRLAEDVLERYPCKKYPSPRDAFVDAMTDYMFTCHARRISRAAVAGGAAVFRYYYPHAYANGPLAHLRAFHTAELPFVFHTFETLDYAPSRDEESLSKSIGGYWAAFATTGDPNYTGAPTWPPYTRSREVALGLDTQISATAQIGTGHCDFWDGLARE